MGKPTLRQILVSVLLFSAIVSILGVKPSTGNPSSMIPDNPIITIQSPQNGATYKTGTFPLYFTVEFHLQGEHPIRYILNNNNPIELPTWIISTRNSNGNVRYIAQGKALLSNLPDGGYTLTVQLYYETFTEIQVTSSVSVTFTVDRNSLVADSVFLPPHAPYPDLKFDSPNSAYVALLERPYAQGYESFYSNLLPSWAGYSLDNHINTTIPIYGDYKDVPPGSENLPLYNIYGGSLNLTFHFAVNIPLGSHSLTLYANDSVGNWATPQTMHIKVITFEEYASVPTLHPIFNQTALFVTLDSGTMVDFSIHGDIKITQISNATLKTNETNSVLSFFLTGPSGTKGFSNITIPKRVVPNADKPTVYIDDQSAQSQGWTQDANSYYVWYTTSFSTHKVAVAFAIVMSPEPSSTSVFFPTQSEETVISVPPSTISLANTLAAVIMVIVVALVVINVLRLKRKSLTHQSRVLSDL